ncbi:NAD(P)/FAD-dependent oxidoreductase [Candidatus Pantoea multigeneris]|uniref:FAD-binding oxidoreductase n=1 Tax=Candidatus Pantoea multigeneris TaxID=2608357 RepID=A0ABX0R685_9GAMM|nr:FAD-binding oxidoreductase [Pantoea multigeneris]NIF20917.1 FAD-binding oxidoreductase [Pantoea multigeneris]
MGPSVDVVPSSPTFPTSAEVVVIGGGIIGVATALSLVQQGIRTVLLEKGTVAAEQSSRNWGWCRRTGRDLRELPLINLSMQLWEGMNERVQRETGFRRCGILYAARNTEQHQRHQSWVREAQQYGIHSDLLSPEQVRQQLPQLQGEAFGGMLTPLDGRAEPQKAVPAMVQAAMELGLNLQQHCAVRTIERAAGQVSEVVTEHGAIRCQQVVVAGGAWSRILLQGLGITLPQLKVLSSVVRTHPVDFDPGPCVSFGSVAMRKRLDGGLTVASSAISTADITLDALKFSAQFMPAFWHERKAIRLRVGARLFEEALHWKPGQADKHSIYEAIRVLDPQVESDIIPQIRERVSKLLPALTPLPIAQSWGGLIDSMPDAIPVISAVESLPGLFVATGFSGHGFGIGPGAGQLMADLVLNRTPSVDAHPFRLSRFSDGEKIKAQFWL